MFALKLAFRRLARTPILSATLILSLGVGAGASTAIFTLANHLILKPQSGVLDPEELVDLGRTDQGSGFDTSSHPNFLDYQARNQVFDGLCAYQATPRPLGLAGPASAESVYGLPVSRNYFSVLGVQPALGGFFPLDPGAEPRQAVLSHRLWQRRFGSDREIVGKSFKLNGEPFTIIGVASADFEGLSILAADLWVPLQGLASPELLNSRLSSWLMMTGRLRPGVDLERAGAAMRVLASNLEQEFPEENDGRGLALVPSSRLPAPIAGPVSAFVGLLAALAGTILLITCVNVAGILLARASSRHGELAVSLALGAGRRTLVCQLLSESVVLFLTGAAAALWFSQLMVRMLVSIVPELPIAVNLEFSVDLRVVLFCFSISMLAGVATGLAPALQATRHNLMGALRDTVAEPAGRWRLRRFLVGGQVALALLLLVATGLFLRSLENAASIDPGFDFDSVHVFSLDLTQGGYDETGGQVLAASLLERVQRVPGLQKAALSRQIPLDGSGFALGGVLAADHPDSEIRRADWNIVTPGYFQTLDIPLLEGRDFESQDRASSPDVAIVNQTLAERLWPGRSAIGRRFLDGPRPEGRQRVIVGVARDAKYRSLGEAARLFVYVPLAQNYNPRLRLMVKADPISPDPAEVMRTVLAELDPNLPLLSAQPLAEAARLGLLPQRLALSLAGGLGVIGLLLVLMGVYGVSAQAAQRRTRELGIRAALGARRIDLTKLMLWEGMAAVLGGVLVGLAGAAALTHLVGALLYGISPLDPASFAAGAALLTGSSWLASYLPARRAASLEPAHVLRHQ